MKGTTLWLTILVALSLVLAARAEEGPRVTQVKVWYYPPAGSPALIQHWVPNGLKVDHRFSYSRLGKFRIRVELSGGSRATRWLSIKFKDEAGTTFDLPGSSRQAPDGVKDVYWLVPYNFVTGVATMQVLAYSKDPQGGKVKPVSQSTELTLGTITSR